MKVVVLISLLVYLHGVSSFVPARSILSRHVSTPGGLRSQSGVALNAASAKVVEPVATGLASRVGQLFSPLTVTSGKTILGGLAVVLAFITWFQKIVWTASRTYDREANSVGREYDAWTEEGILEYYWGEHIHLGYYNEEERAKGYLRKNFIQAKYDFIDEMAKWGEIADLKPEKVLDVGCGIGGTSRYLAKMYGEGTSVTGITLSQNQVDRATTLAKDRGINNTKFQVMDALAMDFPDNSFDVVWACESGEHMPDKKKYVEEMIRVLKPGGRIVIATWCQRDETPETPFNKYERKMLDFLYSEWTHPYFISINDYKNLMLGTGDCENVKTDDWMKQTIASWRHSIWVGVFDPWPVLIRPHLWYKCFRDGLTLERMHKSFDRGLMEYGMMCGSKKPASPA